MLKENMQAIKNEAYVNKFEEVPVGAGFWAFRRTIAASGKAYTKLVKRDRSPSGTIHVVLTRGDVKLKPSVGHNPRRQKIIDKRIAKQVGER